MLQLVNVTESSRQYNTAQCTGNIGTLLRRIPYMNT